MRIILAFLLGVAAGMRSMTPAAGLAWAVSMGLLPLGGTPLAFLALPVARWLLTAAALGELVTDKLPFTPSRKAPLPFFGRLFIGAACGAALCFAASTTTTAALAACVAAGLAGAAAGTYGGYEFRQRLVRATGGRDLPIALLEDALCILLTIGIVSQLPRIAPRLL